MNRRQFIARTSMMVTLPIIVGGSRLSAMAKPFSLQGLEDENDRVLVLIQLNGGNDGLNTLVPLDQYSNLFNARKQIIIPENKLIGVSDTLAFHPSMEDMGELFAEGELGIIQNVGYPNQNRSHFRSMEIWATASPANEFWSTGWLGRYFDSKYPGFPETIDYERFPDPFAISMGSFVSDTCQGRISNFSLALHDPFALIQLQESNSEELVDPHFSEELAFLEGTINQTNIYSNTIKVASERGANKVEYPDTQLGQQLKNVALMISGGLKTKVYVAHLGGFDTHARQIEQGDTTSGVHSNLLSTLSEAIYAFQQDLRKLGLEQRVFGMTYSEFGRQILENFSLGTDHGTAAPLFFFGFCANGRIVGPNPEIPAKVDNQAGVPMKIDFRDVYGAVLLDWFGLSETEVRDILYPDFTFQSDLIPCADSTSIDESKVSDMDMHIYPNPFSNSINIQFRSGGERIRLIVLDIAGSEMEVIVDKKLSKGVHKVRFNGSRLASGSYYIRIQADGENRAVEKIIKM